MVGGGGSGRGQEGSGRGGGGGRGRWRGGGSRVGRSVGGSGGGGGEGIVEESVAVSAAGGGGRGRSRRSARRGHLRSGPRDERHAEGGVGGWGSPQVAMPPPPSGPRDLFRRREKPREHVEPRLLQGVLEELGGGDLRGHDAVRCRTCGAHGATSARHVALWRDRAILALGMSLARPVRRPGSGPVFDTRAPPPRGSVGICPFNLRNGLEQTYFGTCHLSTTPRSNGGARGITTKPCRFSQEAINAWPARCITS